jgi:hypothetical protein
MGKVTVTVPPSSFAQLRAGGDLARWIGFAVVSWNLPGSLAATPSSGFAAVAEADVRVGEAEGDAGARGSIALTGTTFYRFLS